MNKLLNELRLDAGIYRLEDNLRLVSVNKEGKITDPLEALEKFAELIIQECRKVITDFDGVEDFEYTLNPRSVRWDCDCEIRDHFGLED
jgi:hypothetical protein